MPDFAYVGLDTAGRERRGSVRAETPDQARAELARADAIVVPLRFGGGTRVKILEAFAWRIPVVSTKALLLSVPTTSPARICPALSWAAWRCPRTAGSWP